MFPHLIRAKYHQITLNHSITLAFSTSIIRCINFPDSVELFKTVPDVDEPFWKGHIEAGHQNNFQPSLWPGQKSGRIDLTSKNYFLRPETRHRPHQSSQYNAFPSQDRDQCLTRLAKMRPNTVTYWTTVRKTLVQAARKKSRKWTDHGKQLLTRTPISNVIVFYVTERIMGNDM